MKNSFTTRLTALISASVLGMAFPYASLASDITTEVVEKELSPAQKLIEAYKKFPSSNQEINREILDHGLILIRDMKIKTVLARSLMSIIANNLEEIKKEAQIEGELKALPFQTEVPKEIKNLLEKSKKNSKIYLGNPFKTNTDILNKSNPLESLSESESDNKESSEVMKKMFELLDKFKQSMTKCTIELDNSIKKEKEMLWIAHGLLHEKFNDVKPIITNIFLNKLSDEQFVQDIQYFLLGQLILSGDNDAVELGIQGIYSIIERKTSPVKKLRFILSSLLESSNEKSRHAGIEISKKIIADTKEDSFTRQSLVQELLHGDYIDSKKEGISAYALLIQDKEIDDYKRLYLLGELSQITDETAQKLSLECALNIIQEDNFDLESKSSLLKEMAISLGLIKKDYDPYYFHLDLDKTDDDEIRKAVITSCIKTLKELSSKEHNDSYFPGLMIHAKDEKLSQLAITFSQEQMLNEELNWHERMHHACNILKVADEKLSDQIIEIFKRFKTECNHEGVQKEFANVAERVLSETKL